MPSRNYKAGKRRLKLLKLKEVGTYMSFYMMDSYQGWDLKAVVDLRGFAFKYVDNAPCSGLLTYFDGRSYLFFLACGNFEKDELTALYKKANQALKVSEILKLQARPNLY